MTVQAKPIPGALERITFEEWDLPLTLSFDMKTALIKCLQDDEVSLDNLVEKAFKAAMEEAVCETLRAESAGDYGIRVHFPWEWQLMLRARTEEEVGTTAVTDPLTLCIELPFGDEDAEPRFHLSLSELVDNFLDGWDWDGIAPVDETHITTFADAMQGEVDKIRAKLNAATKVKEEQEP